MGWGKIIFFGIVALATLGQTISDWTNLNGIGKLFMIALIIGFSGLTYSAIQENN
jgi:hypothetical protein